MPKYIDREKLIERLEYYLGHTGGEAHYAYSVALKEIRNAPAEDVLPVVHGEWKVTALKISPALIRTGSPHCSVCGKSSPCRTAFCPNCFAKMDGEVLKSMKRAGDSAKNVTESLKNITESLKNVNNAFENADRCVCCGEIVPEGRQVCPGCETGGDCDG
jgi:hypothetical protein